jgi:replicative DNA helicase
MLKMALHMAKESGKKVLFFTHKESAYEIAVRLIMAESRRDRPAVAKWLRKVYVDKPDEIKNAVDGFRNTGLAVVVNTGHSWKEIMNIAQNENGIAAIFIDDIDRLDTEVLEKLHFEYYIREDNTWEMNHNSNEYHGHCLKSIANKCHVPVIASFTINYDFDSDRSFEPGTEYVRKFMRMLPFLDRVIAVHRDEYFNPESEKKMIAELFLLMHSPYEKKEE